MSDFLTGHCPLQEGNADIHLGGKREETEKKVLGMELPSERNSLTVFFGKLETVQV